MQDDNRKRLAVAVHKLTSTHTTELWQGQKKGRKLVILTHQALITQLEAGAVSTGAGYGGTAPQSRNILDTDTLSKLTELRRALKRSWHNLYPNLALLLPISHEPLIHSLHLWHQLFTAHLDANLVTEERLLHEANTYTAWVAIITAKFDPPNTIEGIVPCPKCRARWTTPADLEDRQSAIVYTLHGTPDTATATCRACGTSWKGRDGLLRLTREQNTRHAEKNNNQQIAPAEPVE